MGALKSFIGCLFVLYFTGMAGQTLPYAGRVEMRASDASVRPGGVGQLVLNWSGSRVKKALELQIDASSELTFMELPSVGDHGAGSALIMFIAHPYMRPGKHPLTLSLVDRGMEVGRCEAFVAVDEHRGVESNLIEEFRDSVKMVHINTGNAPIWVNGQQINVRGTAQVVHAKENDAFIRLQATAEGWDSTYVFAFKKQFYPATATAFSEGDRGNWGQFRAQHQRSGGRNFSAFQAFTDQDIWQLSLSTWNNDWRMRAGVDSPIGTLTLGRGAYSLLPMMRQNNRAFLRLQGNQWDALYHGDVFGAMRRWELTNAAMSVGLYSLEDRIMPAMKLHSTGEKYGVDYQMMGGLGALRWHWKNPAFQTYGRMLRLSPFWQGNSIQQSSALVGASGQYGHLRWNHQSMYYTAALGQFHNTQLHLNYGRFQWSARGTAGQWKDRPMYPSSTEFQGLYQSGEHGISLNIRPAPQLALGSSTAAVQYRYRGTNTRFLAGVDQRTNGRAYRAQWSYRKGAFTIDAQGAVYPEETLQGFYQVRCSRSAGHQSFSVSSSRRVPLQLSVNTIVGKGESGRTLEGRVVNSTGQGLANVVIRCEGLVAQSNEAGYFSFQHMRLPEVRLEIAAESLPFASFPNRGYVQEVVLKHKSTNYTIACHSNGGVQGRITVHYVQPPAFRSAFQPSQTTVHFDGPNGSFACRLQQNGKFQISGLPPGNYGVTLSGIGHQFEFKAMEIDVLEGAVSSVELSITERSAPLIIQSL